MVKLPDFPFLITVIQCLRITKWQENGSISVNINNYHNFPSHIAELLVSFIQAYDLKERLEELELKRDEVTIASVEAINMYPLIKLSTI